VCDTEEMIVIEAINLRKNVIVRTWEPYDSIGYKLPVGI
jgi:hypothetical protein